MPRILLLILIVICSLFAWMWFGTLSSRQDTYAIAEGAFFNLTKKMKMNVSEFNAPPNIDPSDDSRMVVLEWVSKSKPGCRIEVDVDRKFANARPTWNCDLPPAGVR